MVNKKPVTLKDLSQELGLSEHTVSRALRGLPGMSADTRRAVLELAHRRGYRTKDQERSLYAERIPFVPHAPKRFLFVSPQDSPLPQLIMSALHSKLNEFGHSLAIGEPPEASAGKAGMKEWVQQAGVDYYDGMFISPLIDSQVEQRLLELSIPRLLINFPPPVVASDTVIWDVAAAVSQAVQHLLKNGHERILYVGNNSLRRGFQLRWEAFQTAMQEAGLPVKREDHVLVGLWQRDPLVNELAGKLKRMKATAILSSVHFDLVWIYYVCQLLNLRIPEDCSLISLERERNPHFPELTRPILLIREAGSRAAERMLRRLAFPHEPYEYIRLQGSFYEGDSVKPLRGDEKVEGDIGAV